MARYQPRRIALGLLGFLLVSISLFNNHFKVTITPRSPTNRTVRYHPESILQNSGTMEADTLESNQYSTHVRNNSSSRPINIEQSTSSGHDRADRGYNLNTCQPRESVVFIKTFKTASTTMYSILSRYGYTRNLSFALPKQAMFLSFEPFRPDNGMLLEYPKPPGFHILNNHCIYNRSGIAEIMRPEAVYITILRNPVEQFYSFALHFGVMRKFNISMDIRSPDFPMHDVLDAIAARSTDFQCRLLHNGQLLSLGLDTSRSPSTAHAVMHKIRELEEEMDLVLINEFLDESLILLKQMMCWTYEDILYISKLRSGRSYAISEEHRSLIESWSFADGLLYNHFNDTLWKKLRDYGPTLSEDLLYFRSLKTNVSRVCSRKPLAVDPDLEPLPETIEGTWGELCDNLLRSEVPFIDLMRNKVIASRT